MDPTAPELTREDSEQTYCYGHPDTPTRLRCSRCDRPICGRCAIPASVGQHCPECVAEARKSAPRVRSAIRATAPVVTTILVVNAIFFLGQIFSDQVTRFLILDKIAVANGDYYRLLTVMVLHGGALHILLNSYILWIYGPQVEQAFGPLRFAVAYVVSGVFASATSYAFGSCHPSVGASGAIFGIVGALLAYLYNRRSSAFVGQYLRNIMTFVALNLFLGFAIPGIDNFAHIGGLVGGIAIGSAFDRGEAVRAGVGTQLLGVAAVIAVAAVLVVWRTSGFSCA